MTILKQLFEIIILKRRPADIYYDPLAAGIAFVAAVATAYFQVIAAGTFNQPLPFVLAQGIAQGLVFYGLLTYNDKANRFIQTVTVLFGVSAILQFVGLLFVQAPGFEILGLIITSWNFFLMILILREAIECATMPAIAITIAYHFLIGVILIMIFPDIFQQMQAAMQAAG